jgi:hypothetical protein
MDAASFVATLERLWQRSAALLWALGVACTTAFVGLAVGAWLDAKTFGPAAQSSTPWLLPLGIALLVLAGFRSWYDRRHPALRFVPIPHQFFWHVTRQQDGQMTIQIGGRFEVYNLAASPMVLIEFKIVRPKIRGRLVNQMVHVEDTESDFWGRYPIPAYTRVLGSVHAMAFQDFSQHAPEMDIAVKVRAQTGTWYKVEVPRVRKS